MEFALGVGGDGGEAGLVSELAEVIGDECAVVDVVDGGHLGWGSNFESFEDHAVACGGVEVPAEGAFFASVNYPLAFEVFEVFESGLGVGVWLRVC